MSMPRFEFSNYVREAIFKKELLDYLKNVTIMQNGAPTPAKEMFSKHGANIARADVIDADLEEKMKAITEFQTKLRDLESELRTKVKDITKKTSFSDEEKSRLKTIDELLPKAQGEKITHLHQEKTKLLHQDENDLTPSKKQELDKTNMLLKQVILLQHKFGKAAKNVLQTKGAVQDDIVLALNTFRSLNKLENQSVLKAIRHPIQHFRCHAMIGETFTSAAESLKSNLDNLDNALRNDKQAITQVAVEAEFGVNLQSTLADRYRSQILAELDIQLPGEVKESKSSKDHGTNIDDLFQNVETGQRLMSSSLATIAKSVIAKKSAAVHELLNAPEIEQQSRVSMHR